MTETAKIRLEAEGVEKAAQSFRTLSKEVRQLADNSFNRLINQQQRLTSIRRSADAQFEQSLANIQKAQRAEHEYKSALEQEALAQKEVAEQAERANKARLGVGTGTASTRPASLNDRTINQSLGGLAALNVPGASNLRFVADIADVTENLPKLAEEIKALGLAGSISTLAIGAYAAGFYLLNRSIKAGAEEVREAGKAELERLEGLKKTREELRSLSFDEVQQKISDLQEDIENTTATRLKREQELAEQLGISTTGALKSFLEASAQLTQPDLTDPIGTITRYTDSLKELADVTGLSEGEIQVARDEIEGYNTAIAEQSAELQRLQQEVLAFSRGSAAAQEFVDELDDAGQRLVQTREDIGKLSSDNVRQQIADAEQSLAIARDNRAAVIAQHDELLKQWASATGDTAKELQGEIEGLVTASQIYDQQIADEAAEVERLTNEVAPLVAQREREARAVERMTHLQERASDQAEHAADALQKLTAAQQSLADFEGQQAQEGFNKRREASIRGIYDAQLKSVDAEIEAAKAAEKQVQAQQKATEAQSTYVKKVTDNNQKFYQQELDRLAEFRKNEARINDDFARDQRRRLEDLNDDLLEATANNDVVAFVRRQKEGSKELSRAAEDFGVDATRRAEDFNGETARNQREHTQQLLEINRQYQEQRIQLQAQSGTVELSLLDQLQAKRAEIIANREASLEQLRQQLEQDGINRRRQSLIAAMNTANEDYRRLNELATTSGRIIASNFINSVIGGMGQIRQAQQIVSSAAGGIRLPHFAEGVMGVTRPTPAIIGDMKAPFDAEAVIPYRQADGYGLPGRSGGGSGSTVVVNLNGDIGNLSRGEVQGMMNELGWKIVSIHEIRP